MSEDISLETPIGAINGVNRVFRLNNIPKYVVVNGVTYFPGDGYVLNIVSITLTVAPMAGSTIRSVYQ